MVTSRLRFTLVFASTLAALFLSGCANVNDAARSVQDVVFPPFFAPSLGHDASSWTMDISQPDSPEALRAKLRLEKRRISGGDLLESVQTSCWLGTVPTSVVDGENPCQSLNAIEALPAWHIPRPPERYFVVVLRETRASEQQENNSRGTTYQTNMAVFDMATLLHNKPLSGSALKITVPTLSDRDELITMTFQRYLAKNTFQGRSQQNIKPSATPLATLRWSDAIHGVVRAAMNGTHFVPH